MEGLKSGGVDLYIWSIILDEFLPQKLGVDLHGLTYTQVYMVYDLNFIFVYHFVYAVQYAYTKMDKDLCNKYLPVM